jgi:hypothetical protein
VIACDGGFRVVVGFDSLGGLLNGTVGFIAVHRLLGSTMVFSSYLEILVAAQILRCKYMKVILVMVWVWFVDLECGGGLFFLVLNIGCLG